MFLAGYVNRMTDKDYNSNIDIGNLLTVTQALGAMEEEFSMQIGRKYKWKVMDILKNYKIELANRQNSLIDDKKAT